SMNFIRLESLGIKLVVTVGSMVASIASGCGTETDPTNVESPRASANAATAKADPIALKIEQAERAIDTGKDLLGAKAARAEVLGRATEVSLLMFGGESGAEKYGTFDVGRALSEIKRDKCPLCDEHQSLSMSMMRSSSWTSIPRARPHTETGLPIFFFDLGAN